MRIISGRYKGKRLIAPKKLPVRPTTDMAKEGLFNILNNRFYFDGLKILDLFAGTGNISLNSPQGALRTSRPWTVFRDAPNTLPKLQWNSIFP